MKRATTLTVMAAGALLLAPRPARSDGQFERMLASARPAAPVRGPTLAETQRWLEEKTAEYGAKDRGAIRDSIRFDGCQARQTQEICDPGGRSGCVPLVHSFSLADLQPRVTTAREATLEHEAAFTLCVETIRGQVQTRRGDTESGSTRLCFSLRDEHQLRRRFAAALTHAIALCQEEARRERARQDAAAVQAETDEPF